VIIRAADALNNIASARGDVAPQQPPQRPPPPPPSNRR
jgi:hypothetical protein